MPIQDDMQRWPYTPPDGGFAEKYMDIIPCRWWYSRSGFAGPTVNQCYLHPITLFAHGRYTIDRLCYTQGALGWGSYILGLYGRGTPNPFVPDGAPLLAYTAVNGIPGTNRNVEAALVFPAIGTLQLDFTNQALGVPYWLAAIFDNPGDTPCIWREPEHYLGRVQVVDHAAGGMAFIDPCPASGPNWDRTILAYARVLSIP